MFKLFIMVFSSFLLFGIVTKATIYVNVMRKLRENHSKSFIKKKRSKKFLRRYFYLDFKKEIPCFWFFYNFFISIFVFLYPLLGIAFIKSDDLFREYLLDVFCPVAFFDGVVWLVTGIKNLILKKRKG